MNPLKIINYLWGLTLINIALISVSHLDSSICMVNIVRTGAFLCNLVMGIEILFSHIPLHAKPVFYKPYWLGMMICNILIVKNIGNNFYFFSIILFLVGIVITLASALALGRSFAITPAVSEIKTQSSYTIIRHPIYLGETVMIVACFVSNIHVFSVIVFLIYVFFLVKRISIEEESLLLSPDYCKYIKNTKWKLLPYIW